MIQHTVSFTWKQGTTEEDVAALRAMLADVPSRVPAVREYRFGPDLGLAPGAADFAVLAVVDDEAGLGGYLDHPFHLEVGERIAAMAETRRRVQFALPGGDPADAARALYAAVIAAWNGRDAEAMAAVFAEDGVLVGFDGSEHLGRERMATELGRIFADHPTPPYVTDVDEARSCGGSVAILRAVAGMAPPGSDELDPGLHTRQTLVAERRGDGWVAVLLQTTPAQFHARPEAAGELTERLRRVR
jgi:uncharacterized protein (TIGR02246 family)